MSDAGLISDVRPQRERLGLSQQALADLVGVSRQAIIAIEAGRQVPSTSLGLRLGRALRCGVEDLFKLKSDQGLTARLAPPPERHAARRPGDARVALAEVNGRWVAHRLPPDPTLSADGVLARAITDRTAVVLPLDATERLRQNVLVSGCAPILGALAQRVGRRRADGRATWVPAGSLRSLDLLAEGLVHVAGVHFSEAAAGEDNVEAVRRRFPKERMLVVNLTRWRQGLVVAADNPLDIRSAAEILRPSIRLAMREEGAAAHKLLAALLAREGATSRVLGGPFAAGHAEVAQLVRSGAADVGVAIESVAIAAGLDFVPLTEERFDLVVPATFADTAPVARFMETLDDAAFRAEAAELPGYDVRISGHVTTLEAA